MALAKRGLAAKEVGITISPYFSFFLRVTEQYICLEDLTDRDGFIPEETIRLIKHCDLDLARYE